jgi:hypothetical protein
MGQGYTRNDTPNNIANGNVITAADLDGEFDAIVAAFNETTGHTHDGTAAEGGAVSVIGPVQEYLGDGTAFYPKTTAVYTLGKASNTWANFYLDTLTLGGTAVTATAAELNVLDGIAATLTFTELNYVDGVTSAIQTQLNTKAPTAGPTFTGTVTIPTADINGGTIDGTVIGGVTPAAISGTTGQFGASSLDVIFKDTQAHTTTDGPALRFQGVGPNGTNYDFGFVQGLSNGVNNAGVLALGTNSAGVSAEAIRITSNGRLAINGTTANAALHVHGSQIINNGNYFQMGSVAGLSPELREASNGWSIQTNGGERIRVDGAGLVGIGKVPAVPLDVAGRIRTNGGTNFLDAYHSGSVAYIETTGGAATPLAFATNGIERVRIDQSGGALLVGCTSAPSAVVTGFAALGTGIIVAAVNGDKVAVFNRNTNNGELVIMQRGGVDVGSIDVTASSTTYNTSSDYRLKENVTPIQGAADIVKAMRPATYTFKADGSWADGFLAHELQELHPVAVTGSKDAMKDEEYEVTPAVEATFDAEGVELTPAVPAVKGTRSVPDYQGVDYSKLTPILTAALQEALNKIEVLEAQNAAFEARLSALEV